MFLLISKKHTLSLPSHHQCRRTFINAKIKWVRDPYLDHVVSTEHNLQNFISLKNLILSSPTNSLPLSSFYQFPIPNPHPNSLSPSKFLQTYPSLFQQFLPSPNSLPKIRVGHELARVHNEEKAVFDSRTHRDDLAIRLCKFLMLTGKSRVPICLIDRFRFDLGLPHDYVLNFLPEYPEYFQLLNCLDDARNENEMFVLGVVKWRRDLAVSVLEKMRMRSFPMKFPNGFDLEKKVKNWVDQWQNLPYISPYENAFHLVPSSDQTEKWIVAVIHELLHLLVSKKTERQNLFCFGEYLGFTQLSLKKALVHFPGIFYVSNKNSMQTVVLRECFRKDVLIERHLLMGMRHRYIHLLNKARKRHKKAGNRKKDILIIKEGRQRGKKCEVVASSDSEVEFDQIICNEEVHANV